MQHNSVWEVGESKGKVEGEKQNVQTQSQRSFRTLDVDCAASKVSNKAIQPKLCELLTTNTTMHRECYQTQTSSQSNCKPLGFVKAATV